MEFLFGSVKSNCTQQRATLLMKRDIFSELGTSLKRTRGSMSAIRLEGKTADDMRLTELADERGPHAVPPLEPSEGSDTERMRPDPEFGSDFEEEDLRGSLFRNCFHISFP